MTEKTNEKETKQSFRKFIKTTTTGTKEINEFEVHKLKKDILTKEDLEEIASYFPEPEDQFETGVSYDYELRIYSIDVDLFLKKLVSYFECEEREDNEDQYDLFNKIDGKLRNWKGYDLKVC